MILLAKSGPTTAVLQSPVRCLVAALAPAVVGRPAGGQYGTYG